MNSHVSVVLKGLVIAVIPVFVAFATGCAGHNTADGSAEGGHNDSSADGIIDARDGAGGDGADLVTGDTQSDVGLDTANADAAGDTPSIDAINTVDVAGDGLVTRGDAILIDVDGSVVACYPIACSMHILQCGDCMDNDGDGLIDSEDPDCLGPCSNNEGPTLDPMVGGTTASACTINCYFNYGIGSGSDDCHWDHRCDPLEVAPTFDPVGSHCTYDPARVGGTTCPATQTPTCLNNCMPLTPNGCDCFGCCTFPEIAGRSAAAGGEWVFLGSRDSANNSTCSFSTITDVSMCHSCTPSPSCINTCGHCEVCIGRPTPPADCFPPPPDAGFPDVTGVDVPPGTDVVPADVTGTDAPPGDAGTSLQCPVGIQPCGLPGQSPCPFTYYCITGCCEAAPG